MDYPRKYRSPEPMNRGEAGNFVPSYIPPRLPLDGIVERHYKPDGSEERFDRDGKLIKK